MISLDNSHTRPNVDRLSKLPNELLQYIFALAYATQKPSEPLSCRLRRFYDAVAFRELKARDDSRVRSLHRTLTGRPGLGQHVRQLTIEEAGDQSRLGFDEINDLFGCLPNLQHLVLRVRHSSWLDGALPIELKARTAVPASIVSLVIGCARRPTPKYEGLEEPRLSTSELPLPGVVNLPVGLPNGFPSARVFFGCFPHLRKLALTSHAADPNFSTSLASIKSLGEFKELTIKASPQRGWRFPDELPAFRSLDSLVLRGQLEHLDADAYKVLKCVSITSLVVGTHSDIDARAVTALIGETGYCPTIRTLRLDNLSAEAPPEQRTSSPTRSVNLYSLLRQFELPRWTTAFSYDRYKELKSVAARAGVDVKAPSSARLEYTTATTKSCGKPAPRQTWS
ncbi:hypothetical protein JCM3774_004675 [Rhodotorula dairenensis]